MNITPLRKVALAGAAFVLLSVSAGQASAATYVSVRVGTPPPPLIVERPWPRPYSAAVWIPGHHEWIRGRWVWVGGYYAYPPHRGDYWIAARYSGGYYYPGHWRY